MADMPDWTCPTCGGCEVPEAWDFARVEWRYLGDKERAAARELLAALQLHGAPKERAWSNALWDALRVLCPATVEALDGCTRAGDFLPIFPEN